MHFSGSPVQGVGLVLYVISGFLPIGDEPCSSADRLAPQSGQNRAFDIVISEPHFLQRPRADLYSRLVDFASPSFAFSCILIASTGFSGRSRGKSLLKSGCPDSSPSRPTRSTGRRLRKKPFRVNLVPHSGHTCSSKIPGENHIQVPHFGHLTKSLVPNQSV